ncbi:MAG: hypothetical protein IJY14_03905 [Acholeplasmatales bacterium]|nr:hypothetical protein [Acholeplasmatales bacterium]
MIRKLSLLITIVITLLLTTPSITYAASLDEVDEFIARIEAAERKSEGVGLNSATSIWMTPNIDLEKGMEFISKWMIWDDDIPYIDNNSNDDVSFTYEIRGNESMPYVVIYFKKEIGSNVYGYMTRVEFIESYNNAEYIIASSDYDCYTICVDGNTYNGDLGILLSDAIKQQKDYETYPEILMPYENCTDIYSLNGCINFYKEYDKEKENLMALSGYVGFDLTKDSYTPEMKDPTDDDYIYGGDENNKIDTTPTEPGEITDFNVGEILGYIISGVLIIVLAYVIYIIGKELIKIFKK